MLKRLVTFLNRPIAEDFSFKNQIWQSLQAGLYVFLFIYLFGGSSVTGGSRLQMLALFGVGCTLSTLLANWVVPALLPAIYNEDRWTVWRHVLHTLFILFCISVGNQALLILTNNEYPSFWQMYSTVTVIGFFPIIIGVFITEQRRLKRNLAHAQALNEQVAQRAQSTLADAVSGSFRPTETRASTTKIPGTILLTSENGKERLSLQPDQLLYIESIGNYVEVHWLNGTQPDRRTAQKTVLRSTLKEMAERLAPYPQSVRCHRAFLVNVNAVSQTEGNARGYQLTLTGADAKIPVSRSYLDAFDAAINALG